MPNVQKTCTARTRQAFNKYIWWNFFGPYWLSMCVRESKPYERNTPMNFAWQVLKFFPGPRAIFREQDSARTDGQRSYLTQKRHFRVLLLIEQKGERKWRIKYIPVVTLPLPRLRRVVQLHWSQASSWWVLMLRSLQTGPISQHIYARNETNSAQIRRALVEKKIQHNIVLTSIAPRALENFFLAPDKGNPDAIT